MLIESLLFHFSLQLVDVIVWQHKWTHGCDNLLVKCDDWLLNDDEWLAVIWGFALSPSSSSSIRTHGFVFCIITNHFFCVFIIIFHLFCIKRRNFQYYYAHMWFSSCDGYIYYSFYNIRSFDMMETLVKALFSSYTAIQWQILLHFHMDLPIFLYDEISSEYNQSLLMTMRFSARIGESRMN